MVLGILLFAKAVLDGEMLGLIGFGHPLTA